MRYRTIQLPEQLAIGTATSAHQVEGGLDNSNDIGDFSLSHPHSTEGDYTVPAGAACDHYNKFPTDLDLLCELNLKVYRFGIEWARIEPAPGRIDEKELEHYRQVFQACEERGITPIPTLHHFTSPKWLISQGGWESDHTPAYFARYAKLIAEQYGIYIVKGNGYLCTLNEVNTGLLNAEKGHPDERVKAPAWTESAKRLNVAPSRFRPWKFASTPGALECIAAAHHGAVNAIRSVSAEIRVGLTMASQDVVAADAENQSHIEGAAKQQWLREGQLWDVLERNGNGALLGDFIGVQPYTHLRVGNRPDDGKIGILAPPEGARLVKQGYEFAPQALGNVVRRTAERFPKVPLLCTEFGVGTDDDAQRLEYIQLGLAQAAALILSGIDLRALIVWSTMDNWEWRHGFDPRYGLIHVDYGTQERTFKQSALFLSEVADKREFTLPDRAGSALYGKNENRAGLSYP